VHDVLAGLGGLPLGYTRPEGYLHSGSRSLRGGLFLGLPIDQANQQELTAGRVEAWCARLLRELRQHAGGRRAAPCCSLGRLAAAACWQRRRRGSRTAGPAA
jgi:hypothetical protein